MKMVRKAKNTTISIDGKPIPEMPPKDKFYFKFPCGGMTPYPPENCKAGRILIGEEGHRWADCYFCATRCAPHYCNEYKEYRDYLYSKMGKDK